MIAFDWQSFLDRHGIGYRPTKTDLYIHCPFCGDADSGQKMGVSVRGKGWGCWRVQTHRGMDPTRLIAALLRCSWGEALRISGRGAAAGLTGLGGFMAAVEGALGKRQSAEPARRVQWPDQAKVLANHRANLFTGYFYDRGFNTAEVRELAHTYRLRYAMTGDWSYRLLIPVYDENGDLATWTGRAINDGATLRYKTLTADPVKAAGGGLAKGPINDYLLGLPDLFDGGDMLVIAEGPFDAMRLSLSAGQYDARTTCLFGKAITPAQVDLLLKLSPLYRSVVLLLDPDAALDALAVQQRVAPLGVVSHWLTGDDDPGEMKTSQIRALLGHLQSLANGRTALPPRAGRGAHTRGS